MDKDAFPSDAREPSDLFEAQFRARLVESFGSDGAWLVLSIIWYGWRAHYDIACAVAGSPQPAPGSETRPPGIAIDFQIVKDLQVQATLFAVAEQFATVVRAAWLHVRGVESFFDAYVGAPTQLRELVDAVSDLTRDDVVRMLGNPRTFAFGAPRGREVPDASTADAVDAGGLYVPRDALRREAEHALAARADALIDLVVENVAQLRSLVEVPPAAPDAEVDPRPLRDVDNAFRHGLRVLFHECVPESRRFRIGSPVTEQSDYSVDLYMPHRRGPERIRFGSVSCTPQRTADHLIALRELSTRVGQFVRAFAGHQVFENALWLLAACDLRLPEPPIVG